MKWIVVIAVIIFLLVVQIASADVPRKISYQGVLTDGAGTPVTDGNYDITFKIYNVDTGGSALWTETNSVGVSGGIFNTLLGSVTPLDLPFDTEYWLGVSVGGGAELSPRRRLTSVPYALNSQAVKGSSNTFGGTGDVGIGTPEPDEKLEVTGGVKIGNTSSSNAGTIRWTGSDFEGYDGSIWQSFTSGGSGSLPPGSSGQTLRHNGTDWVASSGLYNDGTLVGINSGELHVGSSTQTGNLEVYRDGVTDCVVNATSDANGGHLMVYDENGTDMVRARADNSGTGGLLYVKRDNTYTGFFVEGNWNGTEEPAVGIMGSSQSARFRMDLSGSETVLLPTNAIEASEILDEPGVASATTDDIITVPVRQSVTVIESQTILAPASGYVLVISTCEVIVDHETAGFTSARFGVSNNDTLFPSNQGVTLFIAATAETGEYSFPVTVHGLFAVDAGANTFYLIGQGLWGKDMAVTELQLSLVFIPSAYGTVEPTASITADMTDSEEQTGMGLTPTEIALKRIESQAANQARIDRELAAMREQIETLKTELAREREGQ